MVNLIVAALVVSLIVFSGYSLVQYLEDEISPIRKLRMLQTPSCRFCKHSSTTCSTSSRYICKRPDAASAKERVLGEKVEYVYSDYVRGTRLCKFERKEDES